jgi:hypothetical protein
LVFHGIVFQPRNWKASANDENTHREASIFLILVSAYRPNTPIFLYVRKAPALFPLR